MTKEDIIGAARRVAMVLANGGGAGYNDGWWTLLSCRVPADLGYAMYDAPCKPTSRSLRYACSNCGIERAVRVFPFLIT